MQLYALDSQKKPVLASAALKYQDYRCIECDNRVRVRGGMHRQNHFYHIKPNFRCRLHGKGMVHLQTQLHLFNKLPPGECLLEYRFPEIKRIGDVAWVPHKLIFEIQCSPITSDEVKKRNQDYRSVGWEVIWILHDKRYNQWRMSAAEEALCLSSHYFTNMDAEGKGIIYDQFNVIDKGIRKHKMESLEVNPLSFHRLSEKMQSNELLFFVNKRLKDWKIALFGDLVHLNLSKEQSGYIQQAQELEKKYDSLDQKDRAILGIIRFWLYQWVIRPYRLFFQMLLEKACK